MTMTFTNGNDTFTVSSPGTYDLDFLAGDDRLNVQGGDLTTAHMGDGNDLIELKLGLATVYGDAGLDKFDIWASDATVDGGADSDTFNFRGGSGQTASGGIGNDRFNFYADAVSVTLNGGDGNDDFYGYGHQISGTISGGLGVDYFNGFVTGTTLAGGGGNDIYRLTVSAPPTFLENPGEGIDSVQVARGFSYTLPDNIENISVQGYSGSVLGSATLTGNALNNSIVAHNNVETINGLDGNDRLFGKGGDDTLNGGNGNDYLDGGTGNDILQGGAGNDTLQGRSGHDTMSGGTGDDVYYVDDPSEQVVENPGEGTDLIRTSVFFSMPANVENLYVIGSAGVDIFGNSLPNLIVGGPGNDNIDGGSGADTIKGGGGNDSLYGAANSTLYGGTGDDTYSLHDGSVAVIERSGEGVDTVLLGGINYTLPDNVENGTIAFYEGTTGLTLDGNGLDNHLIGNSGGDNLHGFDGNDTLEGGGGGDSLIGGNGNDTLDGGDGNDILASEAGDDTLIGGSGNDFLDGDVGADTLTGGAGNDKFSVSWITGSIPGSYDAITDFTPDGSGTGDVLDLSGIDADTTTLGDQAFDNGGNVPGAHHAWYTATVNGDGSSNVIWYGDVNGDGVADFELHVHQTGAASIGGPGSDIVL